MPFSFYWYLDFRFNKLDKKKIEDANRTSNPPVNNNVESRFFIQQGDSNSFNTPSSGQGGNNDNCSLPSSGYLAPKHHMDDYDYSSMMYRQNAHEVKYCNDFTNTTTNRVQYY